MVSKKLNINKWRPLNNLQELLRNSYLVISTTIINSKLNYRSVVFSLIIVNLHYKSICAILLAKHAMDLHNLIVNLVVLTVIGS